MPFEKMKGLTFFLKHLVVVYVIRPAPPPSPEQYMHLHYWCQLIIQNSQYTKVVIDP